MSTKTKQTDHLTLKWGTLKSWSFHSDKAIALLKEYNEIGSCTSAMLQHDTGRQKEIICELIDECNGEIFNDWEGTTMTKDEAKKYVREYSI